MRNPLRAIAILLAAVASLSSIGCTLYAPKNPPTLKSTTSAEQYERIMWQMVEKQQWNKISPLFSTTMVWHVDGKSLGPDQVVPYLQSLKLKDAVVTNVSVHPNGPDMTVAYTLQFSNNAGSAGCTADYLVLGVWQQMKDGSYILTAHSEQRTGGTCAAL
jgi:hypothetical protein